MEYEQNFSIEIEKEVDDKLNWFTHNYEQEISGWLVGEFSREGIKITDLLIPHQEVGGASVDTDGKSLIKLRKEYGDKCLKIIGHWHCITREIPILLNDGSTITAKELYESKNKYKLVAYDYNDDFEFISPKSIKKEYSPEILEINAGNKIIRVTPNHLLMGKDGNWKKAEDLVVGEDIRMLKHFKQEVEYDFDVDLAYLYGSLLSEGHISVKRTNKNNSQYLRGGITNNERWFLEKNKKIIKSKYNYDCTIVERRLKKDGKDYSGSQLIIGVDRICREFVNDGFIVGRGIKRIPEKIMTANKKAKDSFLEAFIEGDGSIEKRGINNEYKRIYTAYKEMASDFCYLLSSLGYKPLMRKTKQNFEKKNHDFIYEVYYQSIRQKEEKRIYDRNNKSTYISKIKSIEKLGGEDVYSIEIPELHNYVCGFGGFISHNSHNTMSNFWSTTDDDFIKQYMDQRDRAIFIVSSKSNGHRVRLELRNPISLSMDELEYSTTFENEILGEELKKVIEEKVTECKVVVSYGGYNWDCNKDYTNSLDNGMGSSLKETSINDEADNMIHFNSKNNNVVVKGLTFSQCNHLEDLGQHDSRMVGQDWEMVFRCKKKKDAIRIMKEIKSYLVSELELNYDYSSALDGSY